ncbi:MAG: chitobiase/beta-hexosaminidase C-terminal domain-containing protein [Haliscomenobacter sp.]|nr:chitobiase/beta-hexosaminidase C-terminal domain-containing protein [Haliscomenobacter sp.]
MVYINSGGGGNLEEFTPPATGFTLDLQIVHHYCTFSVFLKAAWCLKPSTTRAACSIPSRCRKPKRAAVRPAWCSPRRADPLRCAPVSGPNHVGLRAAFDNLEIRYTLDGTEPTRNSPAIPSP